MLQICPKAQGKRVRSRFSPTQIVVRRVKKNAKLQALLVAAVTWSLAWKGASLWRAAKDDSKPWFIALLAVNSLGILDAIYIFGVHRRKNFREREMNAIFSEFDDPITADLDTPDQDTDGWDTTRQ